MTDRPPDPTPPETAAVTPKRRRGPGAGRPRKSAALHVLEGTRSRAPDPRRNKPVESPAPAAPADPVLSTPPATMVRSAKAFWLKNAPRMISCGRLNHGTLSAWTALLRRYAAWDRAETQLLRLSPTADHYQAVATTAARAYAQWTASWARFGGDPLSDSMLAQRDGSSFAAAAPAVQLPAEALEPSRGAAWLYERGRTG